MVTHNLACNILCLGDDIIQLLLKIEYLTTGIYTLDMIKQRMAILPVAATHSELREGMADPSTNRGWDAATNNPIDVFFWDTLRACQICRLAFGLLITRLGAKTK